MLPSWLTHWPSPTLAPMPRRDRRARRRLALEHLEDRTVPSHTNPNASPTVGVYDENVIDPNTVDFVAAGSSFTDAEFASRVATAFNENRGGVIDGSILGAFYRFGVDHPKVLRLGLADGTNWGIGTGHHISGTGGFASTSDGGYDFTSLNFVEIDGGAPDEHVVAFGLTALSISERDYGNVTVTGRLASGGTMSATRAINNATGAGDTFYGLEAPGGDYFTGFSLRYDGPVSGTPDTRLWFDDIGFITAQVTAANRPPAANDDAYTIDEDTLLNEAAPGVLGNDTDADGDTLTAALVSGPSNAAAFRFNADGSFLYLPAFNFNGTDSFTCKANDGELDSNVATVTITVNPVNDAPFVDSPTVTTPEDQALNGSIDYLEADGDPVIFELLTGPANGSAVVNPDGTFTYTPDPDFNGTDSFTFRARDDKDASRDGTVTVVVTPVNDAPVAGDDALSVNEDETLTITVAPVTRLFMQSEPGDWVGQGGTYEYTPATADFSADQNFDNGVSLSVLQPGISGDFWFLDFAAPFEALLTPGAYPNAMRFPFQDADRPGLDVRGNGRGHNMLVGEFTVFDVEYGPGDTVNRFAARFVQQGLDFDGTVDPPLTGTIQYNTTIGAGGGVLANDADVDGDLFTAVLVSGPSHGVLTLNPDGSLTYTPDPDFTGTDSFTYRANDGAADGNVATVTITVTPVNDGPDAAGDSATTADNAPVTVAVLANDTDADGDTLSVTGASDPAHGTATVNPDGTVTYTPDGDFAGTDSFTYTISDGNGGTDTATVEVRVLPRLLIDDVTVTEGDSGDVFADFTVRLSNASPDTVTVRGATADGSATAGEDYRAVAGSVGTFAPGVTSLTFRVIVHGDTDGEGDETFFVNLSDPTNAVLGDAQGVGTILDDDNAPPVAADDGATTAEGTPVTVAVLANDTDADGDTLAVTEVTQGSNGSVAINPDGTVTYTPAADFSGTDSFTCTISDGNGGTDTATVTVTVTPVNDAPVNTVPGSQTTDEDATLTFTGAGGIFVGDVDAGAGEVRVTLSVDHGTLALGTTAGLTSVSGDGTAGVTFTGTLAAVNAALDGLVYTPDPDFNGTDTLTVTTDDQGNTGAGGALTDTDTVAVTVNAVNDAPVNTVPGEQTGFEDVPLLITGISVSDVDAGDGVITVTLSVGNGTLTVDESAAAVSGNGTSTVVLTGTLAEVNAALAAGVTYLGALNFGGTDTLTVTTDDQGNTGAGGALADTDTVAIQVLSVPDQIAMILERIDDLVARGVLNHGQGNALKVKLNLRGNHGDIGKVNAFINHVEALVNAGILTEEEAAPLLEAAEILLISLTVA